MTRRRLATALLVFVALWPAVTLWLQARWDVDPWKLMSFGMYAAPGRRLEDVRVTVTRDGAPVDVDTTAFRQQRRTLGRLATPDFAGRIEIVEVRLDAETGRVVLRRETLNVRAQ